MGEHDGHRERTKEKYRNGQLRFPTDAQLLELFLFYVIPRRDVRPLAESLIRETGGLANLLTLPKGELLRLRGVGEETANTLALAGEAMRRSEEQRDRARILSDPAEVCGYIRSRLKYLREESIYVICLDGNLRPVSCDIAGDKDALVRTVAARAAASGSTAVILASNSLAEFPALSAIGLDGIRKLNGILSDLGIVLLDYVKIRGEIYSSAAELGALADSAPIRREYRPTRAAPLRKTRYKVRSIFDKD